MKGPLDFFFSLGDRVTKGDPNRQQDFMYYMVWILFAAFAYMFILNTYRLIMTGDPSYAIWVLVGFAISGLQFFTLKGLYEMKKIRDGKVEAPKPPKVESVDEMLAEFDDSIKKGGKK